MTRAGERFGSSGRWVGSAAVALAVVGTLWWADQLQDRPASVAPARTDAHALRTRDEAQLSDVGRGTGSSPEQADHDIAAFDPSAAVVPGPSATEPNVPALRCRPVPLVDRDDEHFALSAELYLDLPGEARGPHRLNGAPDDEGQISIPLRVHRWSDAGPIEELVFGRANGRVTKLLVDVWSRGGARGWREVFDHPDLSNGLDLGDVVLGPLVQFSFVFRDENDDPIEGVRAATSGETSSWALEAEESWFRDSVRLQSDADGLLTVTRVLPGRSEWEAHALGYEHREELRVHAFDGAIHEVFLESMASLVVRLRPFDAALHWNRRVQIVAEGVELPLETGWALGRRSSAVWRATAGSFVVRPYTDAELDGPVVRARLRPDKHGRVNVFSLPSGVRVRVELTDRKGQPLTEAVAHTLEPGEQWQVDFEP